MHINRNFNTRRSSRILSNSCDFTILFSIRYQSIHYGFICGRKSTEWTMQVVEKRSSNTGILRRDIEFSHVICSFVEYVAILNSISGRYDEKLCLYASAAVCVSIGRLARTTSGFPGGLARTSLYCSIETLTNFYLSKIRYLGRAAWI